MLKSSFLAVSLALCICAPVRGDGNLATDSLLVREIADSLKVRFWDMKFRVEGNRIGRLDIFYGGQTGAIPSALGGLDSLRRLFLGITSVTSLPREIGRLKRLDSIDIGSSHIGPTLPEEIGDLPNLRLLRVIGCRLKSLPSSLMKLKKLERVDFRNNAICHVDDSLKQWLLSISPDALMDQRQSECLPTGLLDTASTGPRNPRPGDRVLRSRSGLRIESRHVPGRCVSALGRVLLIRDE